MHKLIKAMILDQGGIEKSSEQVFTSILVSAREQLELFLLSIQTFNSYRKSLRYIKINATILLSKQ